MWLHVGGTAYDVEIEIEKPELDGENAIGRWIVAYWNVVSRLEVFYPTKIFSFRHDFPTSCSRIKLVRTGPLNLQHAFGPYPRFSDAPTL